MTGQKKKDWLSIAGAKNYVTCPFCQSIEATNMSVVNRAARNYVQYIIGDLTWKLARHPNMKTTITFMWRETDNGSLVLIKVCPSICIHLIIKRFRWKTFICTALQYKELIIRLSTSNPHEVSSLLPLYNEIWGIVSLSQWNKKSFLSNGARSFLWHVVCNKLL